MRVAVIDIGSNSIKLLVAEKAADGSVAEVFSKTLESRISDGIGSGEPRLGAEGMRRGCEAVAELAADAARRGAGRTVAVATSAVRDASNGPEFTARILSSSGTAVRILSGTEEANLIGRGLTTDPALAGLRDFEVFDLGGGSLECLCFRDRRIERAISLPLGCVRLCEKLVGDPASPLKAPDRQRISAHVKACLRASGFGFPVPTGFGVVGTGGTLTTARAIAAVARGVPLDAVPARVEVETLGQLLATVGSLDLPGRVRLGGLSKARADVYPTALATLLALAELGGISAFQHSLRNLRWGVAAELLA